MNDSKRDPRIDPRPGDEIAQANRGPRLRVTAISSDGERVSWVKWNGRRKLWDGENTWSVTGWRLFVAKCATVLRTEEILVPKVPTEPRT